MKPTDFHLVYITCASTEEAERIGRSLVEDRLAACANLVPGMTSIYRWKGEICEAQECILLAKTHVGRMADLRARIGELHSYECPCIVSFALTDGAGQFLEWIAAQTATT